MTSATRSERAPERFIRAIMPAAALCFHVEIQHAGLRDWAIIHSAAGTR